MSNVIKGIDELIENQLVVNSLMLKDALLDYCTADKDSETATKDIVDVFSKLECIHANVNIASRLKELKKEIYTKKTVEDAFYYFSDELEQLAEHYLSETKALENQKAWFQKYNLLDKNTLSNLDKKMSENNLLLEAYQNACSQVKSLIFNGKFK